MRFLTVSAAVLMLLTLSGCEIVGAIFKTGVGVGVFIVVVIVIILMVLFGRSKK